MKLDEHYVNPKLVDLYDIENPLGIDSDFFMQLAAELAATRIIDFGCGTGLLTRALATEKREVIGVDPAPAMLAYAQRQPDAERVLWVQGGAEALGRRNADLAIMTGNVAQVFLEDADWAAALDMLAAALKPAGILAFESRNPEDRGWLRWTPEQSRYQFDSPHGLVESWLELLEVGNGKVHFQAHNIFQDTNEDIVADSVLRFRSRAEIAASLEKAGFLVEQLYGGWQREPFVAGISKTMIFVARRKGYLNKYDG